MTDAKKPADDKPADAAKPAPKAAKSREDIIASYVRARPTGRGGIAKRRQVPAAEATRLSVTAHSRCARRGIKILGVVFTCDKPIELEIAKLPAGIANRICRHPELVVVEFAGDKRLTPERAAPRPPRRRVSASMRLTPSSPGPNVAGPANAKRRGVKPKAAAVGSGGATNHPKPAAPAAEKKPRK